MENINNFIKQNSFQKNLIIKKKDISREEFKNINEEHILSLRKKRNNRHFNNLKNFNLAQNNFSYELNSNIIINYIEKEEIYINYRKTDGEFEKIDCLMQMIISRNNNILKYGLLEFKKYLLGIRDKNEFLSKNLLNYFNEKMFRFLLELLFRKKNEYFSFEEYYQIIILLCQIISSLVSLNYLYINIIFDCFCGLLQIAKNDEDKQLKKSIYSLAIKILLTKNISEIEKDKLFQIEQNFFEQIYDELIFLNTEMNNNPNILNLKILYPTLLNIISTIIYNKSQIIINNSNINIKRLLIILSFLNRYLNVSFIETDILKGSLNFLSSLLNFYKTNMNIFDKESETNFRELVSKIEIEKHIILYIYDNSINDFEFRSEIIELINNMILINNSEFINILIKNGISEQISNIQDYLLENENNYNIDESNMKLLFNSHVELIYNLISTQSENAIQDICIENSCISNLFRLIMDSKFFSNNNTSKILEIFDLIIKSKTEYVHSLLLTEGIYDLYKNILFNCNNFDLLELILNDIAIMIERGKNVKTSSGINIVSNHFIKNGIFDLIDNIKGKNHLNERINYLLDEIPNLLKEKTS